MPKSFIISLEVLCQAAIETNDISIAKQALDLLMSASQNGCCFLEKYLVMLLGFCTKRDLLAGDSMKNKVEELLDRILTVKFDGQQLTENLRRPEYKITSAEHLVQLLRRVQDMLDYREQSAIDWLIVLLGAYFVEFATFEGVVEIIDQISAHIDSQCALLYQAESTKCLLKTIMELMDNQEETQNCGKSIIESRIFSPYYSIDYIEI